MIHHVMIGYEGAFPTGMRVLIHPRLVIGGAVMLDCFHFEVNLSMEQFDWLSHMFSYLYEQGEGWERTKPRTCRFRPSLNLY